jgi:hypothetical protein
VKCFESALRDRFELEWQNLQILNDTFGDSEPSWTCALGKIDQEAVLLLSPVGVEFVSSLNPSGQYPTA